MIATWSHRGASPSCVGAHVVCTAARFAVACWAAVTSEDLKVLQAVLRTGSMAAASEALGIDRTTVGRRLEQLEAQLQVVLFTRTRAGLAPTAAARLLEERASRILQELRELEAAARATGAEVRGAVRLTTSEGLASHLVRRGLLELRDRYPELALELLTGNRMLDLAAGEADLALRTAATRAAGVRVRRVAQLAIELAAAGAYLRARGTPASLDALAGHDLLVPGAELARLPEAQFLERARGARVVLRAASFQLLVEAAASGRGLVALPGAWAEAAGLVRVLPLPQIPPRPLWLAIGPGQRERAAVRVVGDEVARLVAGLH
jgi:DNA-binding transcriptional LysR family regulator